MNELTSLLGGLSLSSKEEKEFDAIAHRINLHKIPQSFFTINHYQTLCSFDKLAKPNSSIQISTESLKRLVLGHELND